MVNEGAEMLQGFLAKVKDLLRASDVVHADETGLRVEAALKWVHAASTTDLTLYHLDEKRGTKGMDEMGIIEHLSGVLVHDGFASYWTYKNVLHALCNSHHLRELIAVAETTGQSWATDMIELLVDTLRLVEEAKELGDDSLSAQTLDAIHIKYQSIIVAGHIANPPPEPTGLRGRPKRSKALNLLNRLDLHRDETLRFATDFSVPFTNNLSERDIRMVKIAQKISGGFRSKNGAEAFLAFRSYLSTATKQGVNLLDALQQLFDGNPWMPASLGGGP
jgi:transposase